MTDPGPLDSAANAASVVEVLPGVPALPDRAPGGHDAGARPRRHGLDTRPGVAVVIRVVEEAIPDTLFAELLVGVGAIRQDHVVDPLEGIARHAGFGPHDVQVFLKGPLPILATELFEVLALPYE